ncbi:DsbA family protein [uncultured Hymenobacter sp.]|uniref:DsbA family protein n=1 Tax=uncultured Hymenobacter sp. TaxID=170016 RepID=UPI0035C9E7BB
MSPHLTPVVGGQDHAQGAEKAPLMLAGYGDYECGYCGEAYPLIKAARQALGPRLRFVFRNFSLSGAHPTPRPPPWPPKRRARKIGSGKCTTRCMSARAN